jgi:hypothetical protein
MAHQQVRLAPRVREEQEDRGAPEPALDVVVLVGQFRRLAQGYRFVADRLHGSDRQETFRRVAEDIEDVLQKHAAAVDTVRCIRESLVRELVTALETERDRLR